MRARTRREVARERGGRRRGKAAGTPPMRTTRVRGGGRVPLSTQSPALLPEIFSSGSPIKPAALRPEKARPAPRSRPTLAGRVATNSGYLAGVGGAKSSKVAAMKRLLRRVTAVEWQERLRLVEDELVRGRVAGVVWWDYVVAGWPGHHEFGLGGVACFGVRDEDVVRGLEVVGYPVEVAEVRGRTPHGGNEARDGKAGAVCS